MTNPSSMKVAVIGSGISGMVAAHRLSEHHQVTVFEAGGYVGGHTNTVHVELDGEDQHIDTGFIVFNETNYPCFSALLDELGVASQPTEMSLSVRDDRDGLEYNGSSLNQLFIQRRNLVRPGFHRMIREILRFGREAPEMLTDTTTSKTVQQYVDDNGYSAAFVDQYLVPLGTALWSAPAATFRAFPIRFVVRFLHNHYMLRIKGRPTWRVIRGGSFRYIEKLTARYSGRIMLNTPVESIRRMDIGVCLRFKDRPNEWFDHVIVACHADQALKLLSDPSDRERELLASFPYQSNDAVLHTDTSVLPRHRKAWASWNAHVPTEDRDRVSVTYHMNTLQSLISKHHFCVTLNDDSGIDPAKVLRRIRYEHPVYTLKQETAQRRHYELVNTNRTSFCGAYWGYGFHEDGVRSALAVCEALAAVPVAEELAHA